MFAVLRLPIRARNVANRTPAINALVRPIRSQRKAGVSEPKKEIKRLVSHFLAFAGDASPRRS